ncbi:MAG: branched-chain amino acid ABC transporter permease [Spirochaetales bacterium]|nr:branched-chain amino acid ABC transporter permease [Spirochaetales bacterium]
MNRVEILKKSAINAVIGILLTFPITVIKVNTIDQEITWRWYMMGLVGAVVLIISFFWIRQQERQNSGSTFKFNESKLGLKYHSIMSKPGVTKSVLGSAVLLIVLIPFITTPYTTSIITSALIYIILGLGLNIVVGLGGLLNLGYAAFFGVGAYTYAILNMNFGVGFWLALPLGGIASALFGAIVGLPVLRLKGDYLAIVTLGFGEMTRIFTENSDKLTRGASGIANIPKPTFFGHAFGYFGSTRYIYLIAVALVIIIIFIVWRMENSRVGRSWVAMREDDIACESMGIDLTQSKMTLFIISSAIAGVAGVLFAAKNTFINPQSFTVWESIMILCIVVLGGKGSVRGVILGALILILLPEYLRAFQQYRMLIFGFLLIVMMVFRPGGIIQNVRKIYKIEGEPTNE